MYESYYNFSAKPFQLKPDPHFFFASKGHRRAMAYLEYGLSQGEGFIVITGEIGAGKTTLIRNLFRKLQSENIVASQIVNTHVDADDIVRMVAAAFGLPFEGESKAVLLTRLEQFFRQCERQGKRALLVVDEAQNLSPRAIEELRMLSNFQSDDGALLQTFLLGQPEFRRTLMNPNMQQLQQRVIATYHLGPLDADDMRSYIEHRLRIVGWNGIPSITDAAYQIIYSYTSGIPRKINTLCDRLFLNGYLEELQVFDHTAVATVIEDVKQELPPPAFSIPNFSIPWDAQEVVAGQHEQPHASLEHINERVGKMERSLMSMLDTVRKILLPSLSKTPLGEQNKEYPYETPLGKSVVRA